MNEWKCTTLRPSELRSHDYRTNVIGKKLNACPYCKYSLRTTQPTFKSKLQLIGSQIVITNWADVNDGITDSLPAVFVAGPDSPISQPQCFLVAWAFPFKKYAFLQALHATKPFMSSYRWMFLPKSSHTSLFPVFLFTISLNCFTFRQQCLNVSLLDGSRNWQSWCLLTSYGLYMHKIAKHCQFLSNLTLLPVKIIM